MPLIRKIRERWKHITDPRSDELPKVFSREWFQLLLAIGAILVFITFFVFVTGDKAGDIIIMFASWGFFFVLGVLWGTQKTKEEHRKVEKHQKE